MKILNDESLSKHTTFRMGGIATNYYIPDTEEELLELVDKLKDTKYYIISGGSNLLINDKKTYEHVISMNNACNNIDHLGEGQFYIGSSIKIQKLISTINELGFGGIEELVSLPGAALGGIVYMNAGIGGEKNSLFTISEFVETVKVISKSGEILELTKDECFFGHRKSLFQNNEYVILGARLKFEKQDLARSQERIELRRAKVKAVQDYSGGTYGSCFKSCNGKILRLVKIMGMKKKNVRFSKKTGNWMLNLNGKGEFKDAIALIKRVQTIHRILKKEAIPEVIIWD